MCLDYVLTSARLAAVTSAPSRAQNHSEYARRFDQDSGWRFHVANFRAASSRSTATHAGRFDEP